MKECPHCGAVIDDNLRYCPHCGIRIDHTIPVKSSARKRSAILIAMAVVIILSFAGLIIYRFFATTHLSIDRTALSFVKSGGVMKLPIDYDGYTWSVSHSPEWADVLPMATRSMWRSPPTSMAKPAMTRLSSDQALSRHLCR